MDEGINSMVDTIKELESENERLKARLSLSKSLFAAGKLALAARLVTTANAKNLSQRVEQMEAALDVYDNEILLTPNECVKTKDQDKEKAIKDILDDFKRFSLSEDEAVERIKEVCYK